MKRRLAKCKSAKCDSAKCESAKCKSALRGLYLLPLLLWVALAASNTLCAQVRVACVGNSITYGYGTACPATDSYPAQLQVLLGEQYEVGNFGLSGATLLRRGHRPYVETEQFKQALAFKGDIVVIHLGVNDTDPRDWPNYRDDFIPDYMALIDSFRVARPDCRICIALLSPLGVHHHRFESGTRDWQGEIQEAIRQVAHNTGVELIDFHTLLYAYPHLMEDSIHPVKEGLGMIAAYVKSVLTGDFGGLRLPEAYSSHMVLPHGRPLTIRGTANAAAEVQATVWGPDAKAQGTTSRPAPRGKKGKSANSAKRAKVLVGQYMAVASHLGEWEVELQPLAAGGPYTLELTDGEQRIVLDDVLAGEVWLCSGQSNMAFMLSQDRQAGEVVPQADHPLIRLLDLKPRWETQAVEWEPSALDSLNHLDYFRHSGWQHCTPATARHFSAVGYYFGRMLADSLQIPVGLVCQAVGGAGTEAFIDRRTLEYQFPALLRNWRRNDFIQDWVRERASLNVAKATSRLQRHPYEPCYLFESGDRILGRLPINGVIWYQGESNAHNWDTHTRLFQLLLSSWRTYWNDPQLPSYYVQLSSLERPSWPWFRDSQRRLLSVTRHTGMAVTHDVGDRTDVHPTDKQPVGERLARWALHSTYGRPCVPSGPLFRSMQVADDKAVVLFDYAEGLKGSGGQPVRGFEVAGADGLWHPAQVKIEGDRVVVWSAEVGHPVKVRYAWQPYTDANLVNAADLPASTFVSE